MEISRRRFLVDSAGSIAAAFIGLRAASAAAATPTVVGTDFGALIPDPEGVLDLPAGFSHRVISRAGSEMSDGLLLPGCADGMAAFTAADGRVRLVRNHELDARQGAKRGTAFGEHNTRLGKQLSVGALYDAGGDAPSFGGTTTLVYNPANGRVEQEYLSLAGTERNCSGGPTPWGSWLSCEEATDRAGGDHARDHGYVFEVPAAHKGPVAPVPLKGMGRFNHESAAVDPASGIVYLTEDRADGLFYRFLPRTPGRLAEGGRLEALALRDANRADTRNWSDQVATLKAGAQLPVRWIGLDRVDSPDDDLRQRGHAAGAALFGRGEGLWWGRDEAYFTCTAGGAKQAGQVFRYRPARDGGGRLELFVESTDEDIFANADNLTVAPWGDLLVCEDTSRSCRLIGARPDGSLYRFAAHPYSDSELAGACFAADGRTLFLNIQRAGLTLAISGPFPAAGL